MLSLKGSVEERFKEVLKVAREYERRLLKGRRWNGKAVLIVVDSALDSIGLNYFQIVVPRVKRFYRDYVKTRQIVSLSALSKLLPNDPRLLNIMNNERAWRVALDVSRELCRIKRENGLKDDFSALRFWAQEASYERWREDAIGKISGVGLITFQYLRMQAGVDTTMPDKVIKKVMKRDLGIEAENDLQFIKKMEAFAEKSGFSQILICWAIWLKESDIKSSGWKGTSDEELA